MNGEDTSDGEDTYDGGVIYNAITDAKGYFSSEFRNYVRDQKLICHYWPYVWLFSHDPQADGVDSTDYHLTKELVRIFKSFPDYYVGCLVQFWKVEELTGFDNLGERRFLLTTRNQPFVVHNTSKQNQIHSYRMGIDNNVTGDEGGGGVIGRVYRNKRLEFTPNISYYSSEEYLHRDSALCCGFKSSFSIPIFDSSRRLVGVLQGLFQYQDDIFILHEVISELREESSYLMYLDPCKDFCGQSDLEAKSLAGVVSEIGAVIEVLRRNGVLECARTWILCYHCGFLSSLPDVSYTDVLDSAEEVVICSVHVKKGEGVVGKAATSSHNLVYCQDVSQFSITDYPWSHLARHNNLKSCFAICLKSELPQSQIYVLEFFLNPEMVNTGDLKATLVPILETMKHNFRTFKLASGKEIGNNLFVQVIDAHSPDQMVPLGDRGVVYAPFDQQHNNSEISNSVNDADSLQFVLSTDDLAIGSGENMANNIDEHDDVIPQMDQQNYVQVSDDERVNVVGTSETNVIHTEENIGSTSEECSSKLPQQRVGFNVSAKELLEVSGMKRKDAAQKLNVSESTFRRVRIHYGISRWPPRKKDLDNLSRFGNSSQTASTNVPNESLVTPSLIEPNESNIFSGANVELVSQPLAPTRKRNRDSVANIQTASTTEIRASAPTVQNESQLVTIKAKYRKNFYKFRFSTSSGIDALKQEVSKRVEMDVAKFKVKYQDEDGDWIVVACDEDLNDYISTSTSLGKTTLIMSIERI